MVQYTDLEKLNATAVLNQFKRDRNYSIIIPYSSRMSEEYLSDALKVIVEYGINKPEIVNSLDYCLKELVMNASKANSKRLYFKIKKLDLSLVLDYELGMKTFKKDIFGYFDQYAEKHIKEGYLVKIDFILEDETFIVRVINNSRICVEEEQRIAERMKNAAKFHTMDEVLSFGFDDTEGAGFGLIIIVLMLRKIGLDEKVFSFAKGQESTIAMVKIPLNLLSQQQAVFVASAVAREIEEMPQFPEAVIRLQRNLMDPNCDFISVAKIIQTDVALTTEIIRIANSPIYMLPKKVEDVPTAVRMIGLKGVKNLVLSFGVKYVFLEKYTKEKIDEIMNHSHRVAVYCSRIIKREKRLRQYHDDAFVAALLHDFGRIIIDTLKPGLFTKIQDLCFKKGMPLYRLEDLTDGYNHSLIGAMLAEKWNFPDQFVQCIKYHHIPLEAKEEFKPVVFIVYLANEICYYLDGKRKHNDLNIKVMRFFNMDNKVEFEYFTRDLRQIDDSTV